MKYVFKDEKGEHMHTFDDKPMLGTTSIINEIYPPPLAWWAAGKALEAIGWRDPRKFTKEELIEAASLGQKSLEDLLKLNVQDYMKALTAMYKAHDAAKREGGKKGKGKHALIEQYIKTQMGIWNCPDEDEDHKTDQWADIADFVKWAEQNVDKFLWSEAHCFSVDLWAAGITDFGFRHKNGMIFIGDAKSGFYHKFFIQTGGYSKQIKDGDGLYDSKGNKIMSAPAIDGYMIWNYNEGKARYLYGPEWVGKMEADFAHTVRMYNDRDVIGSETLPAVISNE